MSTPPLTVLIVDDDRLIAALLKGLLHNLGEGLVCEITWVSTGAAARAAIQSGGYRLVLLDYLLPDDDGLALLDAVNALSEIGRPVVIMLTGEGNETIAVEAMKRGAKDYVVKTAINLPGLRRSIVGALGRARLEERLAESTAELRRQNEQMEVDLTMARGVQQALLPQQYPVFPAGVPSDNSRLRFGHRWIPSHKVAGDFFMVFPISDTQVGIFLCDVMGHGVRAALITTLLRGLLTEQKNLMRTPGPFLDELNRELLALLERVGELIFVTAVYLMIDLEAEEIHLANAGHPAPLVLSDGSTEPIPCNALDGPGPALGLMPDFTYGDSRHAFTTGNRLLVYTDGAFEFENAQGEELGANRLRQLIQARRHQTAGEFLDGLLSDMQAYRSLPEEKNTMPDDITLLCVDFHAQL